MGFFHKKDNTTAEEYYDRAMEELNKEDPNYQIVIGNLFKASDKGSAAARYQLGRCYHYGLGTEVNEKNAVFFLKYAIDGGNTDAANLLGTMYDLGEGVKEDPAKGVRLYKWGADNGNAVSLNNLGYMYEHGRGVPQDYKMAFAYYDAAYRRGNATASMHLGDFYKNGKGIPVDIKLASLYYEVAVNRGSQKAQERLDQLHELFYIYDQAANKWILKSEIPEKPETEKINTVQTKRIYTAMPEAKPYSRSPVHSKPHINVGTMGVSGAGKTILTSAITAVLNQRYGLNKPVSVSEIDNLPEEKERHSSICVSAVEYETPEAHYAHFDLPDSKDHVRHFFAGASMIDTAIMVVEVEDENDTPRLREQIQLAREAGVQNICLFLHSFFTYSNCTDEDIWELKGMTITELLEEYDYSDCPIIKGSLQGALEHPESEWGDRIVKLVDCIYSISCKLESGPADFPFYMPVQDIHLIPGRGVAVIGRVLRGTLMPGDTVELTGGSDEFFDASAMSIQIFGQMADVAFPGDYIGVLLRGISRDDIHKGQVLAAPGSVRLRTRFVAQTYFLTRSEGGRHTSFISGYQPQFFFRTANIPGEISLPDDVDMVMPGDSVCLTVDLAQPMPVEIGLRFAVRDNGKTIGSGIISELP